MNTQAKQITPLREIPYNYTSWTDEQIIECLMGKEMATLIGQHRQSHVVRMLFEILGDIWVIRRNPYIQDDLLQNTKRYRALSEALYHRWHSMQSYVGDGQAAQRIVTGTQALIQSFGQYMHDIPRKRRKLKKALKRFIHPDAIAFDPVSRVSHASDASDWRVSYPLAVTYPDSEEDVVNIVRACIHLGFSMVPRGGGTGYTGGAVPLDTDSVVINTEKLDHLSSVSPREESQLAAIHCGAGVVTKRVAEKAAEAGWVFAVDPTSQDSSCIGGNIATNAGGKKAVLWGTTLDNLLSWRMVTPQGTWMEVERLQPDGRKIHDVSMASFCIRRFHWSGELESEERLDIPGSAFRQEGLGKDVSNKYLMGLPGVQKEGCDGIVTSVQFMLHRKPSVVRTVCLEFFGQVAETTPTIVDIKHDMEKHKHVKLAGFEHLDARYIRAIGYQTKAASRGRPKMVLLADVAGEDEKQCRRSL